MQLEPNSPALRTDFQGTSGLGSRHRRSPTGGAANGMPLNAVMEGSRPGTPVSTPPSTWMGCEIAALNRPGERSATTRKEENVRDIWMQHTLGGISASYRDTVRDFALRGDILPSRGSPSRSGVSSE